MSLSRVAALVVSYDTADMLRECLWGLQEASDLEIVVVDNASNDGSADMVARDFPKVTLVRSGENLGFGRAVNVASSHTAREQLLTLNPDCHPSPDAIALLSDRLAGDPELGFVGPKILLSSGEVDHACLRADPDILGAALYLSRVARLFPKSARVNRYSLRHHDYDQEQELIAGTAGCLLFRADAFSRAGGFDSDFFMYGEDLDLCRRVRELGFRGRYVPSAVVTHTKGEATRQRSSQMLVEFHRAMWVYYRKHEARRHVAPVNWMVGLGIAGLGSWRLLVNALRREKRVSAR